MKVEEMRITERPADKGPCGVFNLKEETEPAPVPRTGSMAAEMSLCLLVLAAALVVSFPGWESRQTYRNRRKKRWEPCIMWNPVEKKRLPLWHRSRSGRHPWYPERSHC